MPTPRCATGATHIPGVGDIVVGGYVETEGVMQHTDKAEILLTTASPLGHAGSWCEIAPMLRSSGFPAAEFFNGNVYVAGHLLASTSVEMLSLFSEGPPQWTKVINAPFSTVSIISFNGGLMFGGEFSKSEFICVYTVRQTNFYLDFAVVFVEGTPDPWYFSL
ncbi:unnamed protein product [Rodentolepis nana]|uniref:Dirigent protein n=1 Tax=Rodentolepis nana TaxID=102285 RepID=A0A0R3TQY9_RODNA|nr:unnamed protein product [Rodentolepis nana]